MENPAELHLDRCLLKAFVVVLLVFPLILSSAVGLNVPRLELLGFLNIWLVGVAEWPSG